MYLYLACTYWSTKTSKDLLKSKPKTKFANCKHLQFNFYLHNLLMVKLLLHCTISPCYNVNVICFVRFSVEVFRLICDITPRSAYLDDHRKAFRLSPVRECRHIFSNWRIWYRIFYPNVFEQFFWLFYLKTQNYLQIFTFFEGISYLTEHLDSGRRVLRIWARV